jgi:hypothetical protein
MTLAQANISNCVVACLPLPLSRGLQLILLLFVLQHAVLPLVRLLWWMQTSHGRLHAAREAAIQS